MIYLVNDKITLYCKFILNQNSNKLFDYSNEEVKEINTIFQDNTYIVLNKNNKIFKVDFQSNIYTRNGELLLYHIRKIKNNSYLIENVLPNKLSINYTDILNEKMWYVLRPESNQIIKKIINDDYSLIENDIIKFGNLKYIVPEINKKSNEKEKEKNNIENDEQITNDINYDINNLNKNSKFVIDLIPQIQKAYESLKENNITCFMCKKIECSKDNPIIKFCECNCVHFECIKKYINKKIVTKKGKNSVNYYINGLNCKTCNYIYPLKFKISEKIFSLIEINKPKETEYLILESIENRMFFGYMKFIHLILLNDESVKIGRDSKINDVVIYDPSVSREHAIIKYNKKNGKIFLRNKSNKFGSLILIKSPLKIKEKKIQLQIGKVFIETQVMKYGEFEKIKNKYTKEPLSKRD